MHKNFDSYDVSPDYADCHISEDSLLSYEDVLFGDDCVDYNATYMISGDGYRIL